MRVLTTTYPLLAALLACSACAGAGDARLAAHRAANQVLDLKAHLGGSVASYAEIREQQYAKLAELNTARADIEANSDSHVASWGSAEENDSAAMFKVLSSVNTDDDLLGSAPFRIVEPAPLFQAPQVDNKSMEEIANRLSVIAEKPSLTNRLGEFATFVIAAGKEYKKVTKAASESTVAAPTSTAEPSDVALTRLQDQASLQSFEHPVQSMLPGASKPIPVSSLPLTTQLYLEPEPSAVAAPALDQESDISTLLSVPGVSAEIRAQPSSSEAIINAIATPAPGALPEPLVSNSQTPATSGGARINEDSIADNAAVTDQLLDGLSAIH